jgi:hypothetical protein
VGIVRIVTAGAAVAIMVGSVSLSAAAEAQAASAGPSSAARTHPAVSPVPHKAHMGNYRVSRFAKAAAELPSGLAVQLRKQLGITPEEFLADGQAAADAGKVIASLRADGVTVLDAKLKGTTLTVTVPDAADVVAAEADGANAVIGTAQPVKTVRAKAVSSPANGSSDLLGGDLWFYFTDTSTGEGLVCSTGFNGYDESTGAEEFLTAGHCADYQDTGDPAPANGVVYAATDTDPVALDAGVPVQDPSLGSLDQSSFHFGDGEDSGVVDVTDTEAKPEPAVNTWGSGDTDADPNSTASQGVENSGGTVPILAAAAAIAGEPVCHSGERTGWQCGTVEDAFVTADVEAETETQTVDSIETSVCLLPGDSGGSFVSGEYAVGVASAGNFTPESSSGAGYNNCSGPGYSLAYPTVAAASGEESAAQSEPGFQLAVSVPTPVVTTATADVVTGDGTISGDLPGLFATGTPVSLSLDGATTASTTVDASGDWSFSLAGLADGTHTYTVTAGSGYSTKSTSGTLSLGQVTVSGTAQNGKTLTAAVTGVPSGGTVAYQWNENGKAVATGQTYLLTDGDVGQTLTVTATVTEGANSVSLTSAPTAAVAPGNFTNSKVPGISGTVKVGSKVVASPGTWSVAAPTFTYQWLKNGKPISGATNASYTIPAALAGEKLSVTVTAHKTGYNNTAKTSAATTVAKGTLTVEVKPKLSGTPEVGKKLAVTKGTWSSAPAIKIQWYANGKPVAHATGTSLELAAHLKGETISVTITASKAGYKTTTVRLTESTKVRAT